MHSKRFHLRRARLLAALTLATTAVAAHAADWIVSGNDGKYQRIEGRDTYLASPPADTLTLLDASVFPPKIALQVDVENGIQGPPQAVAITPDAKLALVGAPTRYDPAAKQLAYDTFVQVVTLDASPPTIARIELGTHPQGIAIDRSGRLALVANVDGSVSILRIDGTQVTLDGSLKIGKKRLAGISFTHDGKHALVSLRDEQGVAVLNVDDGKVTDSGTRLSTGVAPYTIDVSSDDRWAVVGNVGLAGLPGYTGTLAGDADSVALIDVSHTPFRTVQYLTVPSLPEGVAISPNGKWIAVQAMDGSNLTPDNPGRHKRGKVVLFEIRAGRAVQTSEAPGGEAAQGIAFTADSRHVIVQFNVERQLALYAVEGGKLRDTGTRIALSGGPSSLRTLPR
ncbi:YncE family protein [Burkholderia vietnamiensis]|uniref:YncE family protein n=1 Tax=Burkholderia vietnamiensis TaxID=60552 RepID=UPI0015940A60|nr:beta-propeller fold lactonase family protein [Burkholderia vietnamiensis]MCA7944677.1 beta-propeller fold lactonase family protein [Burkholderia vietnamiensis]HDR8970736.1 beta-propeller fold lactonase family protein [Burkholderia vietnamiensis]HDR9144896.1 beta-propeller fold lactonase family protein [Burkholderia vietnamiensis]HDR9220781.1 beta-propeller fold lactonase family protein [Burkholderia vietnamiensis]